MQLLESLCVGDVEVVEEGLLQPKVSDKTYSEFKSICTGVANVVKMPKEAKDQIRNEKALTTLSKKPPTVRLGYMRGKSAGGVIKREFTSYGTPNAKALMQKMRQMYKIHFDRAWMVNYVQYTEVNRTISGYVPIGDDGWLIVKLIVANFGHARYEAVGITMKVKPMKDRYRKKYDKLK